MRICSGVGCGRAIEDGKRYCPECDSTSPNTLKTHSPAARDSGIAGKLYNGKRWQWNRNEIVRLYPICERCHRSLSALCDHVVPSVAAIMQVNADSRTRTHWPFDPAIGFFLRCNLQALCRSCHTKKSNADVVYEASGQAWPCLMDHYDSQIRVECTWWPE